MVVASVLLSMGMMMIPPILISLPFKILIFLLVDGWNLTITAIFASYQTWVMERAPRDREAEAGQVVVASSDGGPHGAWGAPPSGAPHASRGAPRPSSQQQPAVIGLSIPRRSLHHHYV